MATTMKLIAKVTLGSDTANIDFTSIPSTHTDLLLTASARSTSNQGAVWQQVEWRLNSSTSNRSGRTLYGTGSATGSDTNEFGLFVCSSTSTASTFGNLEIYIPNYAGSTNKSMSATSVTENNASGALTIVSAMLWANTAAVTSVFLQPAAGSFATGSSFFLYGITKA